ncbi:MAG TPA: hypothetical protein VE033_02240 [Acetobacteraceae bacterium]|nr:hypothetical protein [Acetobacteraceae bacterium]
MSLIRKGRIQFGRRRHGGGDAPFLETPSAPPPQMRPLNAAEEADSLDRWLRAKGLRRPGGGTPMFGLSMAALMALWSSGRQEPGREDEVAAAPAQASDAEAGGAASVTAAAGGGVGATVAALLKAFGLSRPEMPEGTGAVIGGSYKPVGPGSATLFADAAPRPAAAVDASPLQAPSLNDAAPRPASVVDGPATAGLATPVNMPAGVVLAEAPDSPRASTSRAEAPASASRGEAGAAAARTVAADPAAPAKGVAASEPLRVADAPREAPARADAPRPLEKAEVVSPVQIQPEKASMPIGRAEEVGPAVPPPVAALEPAGTPSSPLGAPGATRPPVPEQDVVPVANGAVRDAGGTGGPVGKAPTEVATDAPSAKPTKDAGASPSKPTETAAAPAAPEPTNAGKTDPTAAKPGAPVLDVAAGPGKSDNAGPKETKVEAPVLDVAAGPGRSDNAGPKETKVEAPVLDVAAGPGKSDAAGPKDAKHNDKPGKAEDLADVAVAIQVVQSWDKDAKPGKAEQAAGLRRPDEPGPEAKGVPDDGSHPGFGYQAHHQLHGDDLFG